MRGMRAAIGLEQAMQVHDEIAHLRVIHRLLRLGFPGRIGRGVIRIEADDFDLVEVLEFVAVEFFQLAAEDQMEQLLRGFVGHLEYPWNQSPAGDLSARWGGLVPAREAPHGVAARPQQDADVLAPPYCRSAIGQRKWSMPRRLRAPKG